MRPLFDGRMVVVVINHLGADRGGIRDHIDIPCNGGDEMCIRDSVYFADPYCAWQKGTNENLNGLLREFYPKGRNLSRVAPATLKRNLALFNARPRKVLNFHSAQDLWTFELTSCCSSFHNSLRPGLFAEITQAMGRFHVYHSSPCLLYTSRCV